jgi:hypothetical protein
MAHGRASAAIRAFYFVNIQSLALAERPTLNDRDGALPTSFFSLEFADQFSCGKRSDRNGVRRFTFMRQDKTS